jgi:hypothetical protein
MLIVLVSLALPGCGILRNIDANATRTLDDEDVYYLSGPDAMVERLGEPDVWTQDSEGEFLRMTLIWNCLEGESREVLWESRVKESGRAQWSVIQEKTGECRP